MLQRSHNILKQVANKHDVHLVSLNQKKILGTKQALEEAKMALRDMCYRIDDFQITSERTKLHWASMTFYSYFTMDPYDVNWLSSKDMTTFVNRLAGHEKYDLIHVDTIGVLPYALVFKNAPIVLNHHNIESSMMARRYENEHMLLKKIYFRKESMKLKRFEHTGCPKCAMNLVVSDLDAVRLKEIVGNANVAVVPNGVDLEYFQPDNNHGEKKTGLVFAGGMNYYPNREAVLYFLAEIWPLLQKDDPKRPITIIGRNPPNELLDAARQSNISAPGFVDDVRPYIDSAKIYICPIRNGGGTRLKILDALAMEKPIVATGLAVEGLDLVSEEHYLRAESPSEFVAQIKRLENDENLCDRIRKSGRKFIETRYSWEVIGNRINDAYSKAVKTLQGHTYN